MAASEIAAALRRDGSDGYEFAKVEGLKACARGLWPQIEPALSAALPADAVEVVRLHLLGYSSLERFAQGLGMIKLVDAVGRLRSVAEAGDLPDDLTPLWRAAEATAAAPSGCDVVGYAILAGAVADALTTAEGRERQQRHHAAIAAASERVAGVVGVEPSGRVIVNDDISLNVYGQGGSHSGPDALTLIPESALSDGSHNLEHELVHDTQRRCTPDDTFADTLVGEAFTEEIAMAAVGLDERVAGGSSYDALRAVLIRAADRAGVNFRALALELHRFDGDRLGAAAPRLCLSRDELAQRLVNAWNGTGVTVTVY